MRFKIGVGEDVHKFLTTESNKVCTIGGIHFHDVPGLDADSDGDIVLHAICNAITGSIAHYPPILGKVAMKMCREEGITDSREYVKEALKLLGDWKINNVSLSIEGKRPKFQARAEEMRQSVAKILGIDVDDVGVTFTSGQDLTEFGKGLGVRCLATLSFVSS